MQLLGLWLIYLNDKALEYEPTTFRDNAVFIP